MELKQIIFALLQSEPIYTSSYNAIYRRFSAKRIKSFIGVLEIICHKKRDSGRVPFFNFIP